MTLSKFSISNFRGSTCGQQALTKVTKIMKKRYLKQKHFFLKMTETATKLILEKFHIEISYEDVWDGF